MTTRQAPSARPVPLVGVPAGLQQTVTLAAPDPSADRGPAVLGRHDGAIPGPGFRCFQVRFVPQYETNPANGVQVFAGYLELQTETT